MVVTMLDSWGWLQVTEKLDLSRNAPLKCHFSWFLLFKLQKAGEFPFSEHSFSRSKDLNLWPQIWHPSRAIVFLGSQCWINALNVVSLGLADAYSFYKCSTHCFRGCHERWGSLSKNWIPGCGRSKPSWGLAHTTRLKGVLRRAGRRWSTTRCFSGKQFDPSWETFRYGDGVRGSCEITKEEKVHFLCHFNLSVNRPIFIYHFWLL